MLLGAEVDVQVTRDDSRQRIYSTSGMGLPNPHRGTLAVMNAVEIEEAVSELVSQPFDAEEFPFQFLKAFGAKETTIRACKTS